MTEISKYKLTLPNTQIRVTNNRLSFSIGNIKCRTQAVVYFKFYGYDYHNTLITEHTSDRWLITTSYEQKYETFDLTFNEGYGYEDLDNYTIEIYTLGVDSENPLYFNHLQLNDGELKEYHTPNEEMKNVNVGFAKTQYLNLYDNSETYLQIIRPNQESLSTSQLTTSQQTILVPHIENEPDWDDPVAIFYEFMNMTEQRIGVEK